MRKLATFENQQETPVIVTAEQILTLAEGNGADQGSPVQALLLVDGKVHAAGDLAAVEKAAADAGIPAEKISRADFPGHTIVPGFIDAHAHPLMYGQMLSWINVGPDIAPDIPTLLEVLRRESAKLPAGVPIRGYGYEQRNLAERRHPTRQELDTVASDREVYVMNASGHGGVVNTYTLEKYGVTRDTPNPEGGEFFRDANGDLTGELSDAACNVLTGLHGVKIGHHGPNFHLADEPAEHLRQLIHAQNEFLRGGVTTIGDAQVSQRELAAYLDMADAGELKIRVNMYFLSHLLDEAIKLGLTGPFGNSFLSATGIKFYADGTLGGWTAYFPEGYAGDPCRTGQLYHEPAEYKEMIARAHSFGLQTATHAQSPTAIKMVVDAIESALKARPDSDARHRIEHCGLPTPEEITRMARLGIRPVNQTQHYYNWGEGVTQAIGTPGERFNPLGEFAKAGVPITISSDAPVAEPRPLEAIQTAVTRVTKRGVQLGSDDLKITPLQALRAHTVEAAISLGRETDLGTLEPGKRADFAVLGANPLTHEPTEIASIPIHQTWVAGLVRYQTN